MNSELALKIKTDRENGATYKEIAKRHRVSARAEKEKDLETTMSFFIQDAVCLAPDMPMLKGFDTIKQFYKGFFEPLLSISADNTVLDISESGERAVVVGDFTMVMKVPDGQFSSEGKHLTVLKKVDGEWKCNAVSFNSNAPPP